MNLFLQLGSSPVLLPLNMCSIVEYYSMNCDCQVEINDMYTSVILELCPKTEDFFSSSYFGFQVSLRLTALYCRAAFLELTMYLVYSWHWWQHALNLTSLFLSYWKTGQSWIEWGGPSQKASFGETRESLFSDYCSDEQRPSAKYKRLRWDQRWWLCNGNGPGLCGLQVHSNY